MERTPLVMKCLVIGVIFMYICLIVTPATATQTNDDITICISAGFFPHPNYDKPKARSIGFGITIYVINNESEPIGIFYQIDYTTLSGKPLKSFQFFYYSEYLLPSNDSTMASWSLSVPIPCRITVTVETRWIAKTESRTGYQFRRLVFFPKEKITSEVN